MNQLEKVSYTAKARTTGGRDGGSSRTSDGRLDVQLSRPGGKGNGTNPEQLFAVGWSACFLSAIKLIAAKKSIPVSEDIVVDAEVDLGLIQGAHRLAARLNVSIPSLDAETARMLVDAASTICPYSLATSGNIDVQYNVVTVETAAAQSMEAQIA